jgi:hypothetical protein
VPAELLLDVPRVLQRRVRLDGQRSRELRRLRQSVLGLDAVLSRVALRRSAVHADAYRRWSLQFQRLQLLRHLVLWHRSGLLFGQQPR